MKRALQALTRVRRHRERAAVRRLGAAERSAAQAEQRAEAAPAAAGPAAPATATAIIAARAAELGAWEHAHRLRDAATEAGAERDAAAHEVTQAAAARRQAERLEERRVAHERTAVERARQRTLDEDAVRSWGRRP